VITELAWCPVRFYRFSQSRPNAYCTVSCAIFCFDHTGARSLNLNYAALFPKTSSACPFANFRSNSLSSKWIFVLEKPKTSSYRSKTCLNPNFSCVLKIPLLPDLCKTFLSACTLSTASQEQPDNGAPTEKLTPHEHANAWRDRRSGRPLSLILERSPTQLNFSLMD
jgi:hypothetical protein